MEILQILRANQAKIIESIQTRRTRVELIVADQILEGKKRKSEEKLEHLRNSFLRALFMSHALFTILLLFLPAACLTLWLFVTIFVSSHLVLVTVKCFGCFWYIHLSWWLYKPFVYTVMGDFSNE